MPSVISKPQNRSRLHDLDLPARCSAPPEVIAPEIADNLAAPGRFALVLGLFLVAMFPQVIGGAQTFFYRDFAFFGYPLAQYSRDCFWRGELPLWNPLNDCGIPFLAQWNTMTFYPLSLVYLLLPLSWSLGVFCLGHLFLAGMGMYFLAHRWTGHRLAASVAGLAFCFNGLSLNFLMFPNDVAALGWMPWVIAAVQRGVIKGGRALLIAAVIGAVQMLSGAPEIILFTWLIVGLVSVGLVWRTQGHEQEQDGRRVTRDHALDRALALDPVPQNFGRSERLGLLGAFRFAVLVPVIAGLCAGQLLPFLDLLRLSQRDALAGGTGWSMPAWGWANLIVPLFRTSASYFGVHFQPGQYWTSSYYIGMSVVFLAIIAIVRAKHWRVWLLAGVTLVGLVLALGENAPLYSWLMHGNPGFASMRYPIKFVVLAVFGFQMLAAYGMASVVGGQWERAHDADVDPGLDRNPNPNPNRFLLLIAVLLSLLAIALLLIDLRWPIAGGDWGPCCRNTALRVAGLWLVVAVSWRLARRQPGREQEWLWVALLAFLWLDVLTHAPRQNPTVPRFAYDRGMVDGFLPADPSLKNGVVRAMVTPQAAHDFRYSSIPNATTYCLSRRAGLFSNLNLLEGVPKIDGFYSMYVKQEAEVLSLIYAQTNSSLPRLIDFMGVAYMSSTTNLFSWARRGTELPLVSGGQKPVFADAARTVQGLSSDAFDPRQEVYLPVESKAGTAGIEASHVDVKIGKVTAHETDVTITATNRALIVLSRTFYHPWKCFLDGQPVPILRANHAFQAVIVPAGTHRLEFVYRDETFAVGVMASALSMIGCVVWWRKTGSGGRWSTGGRWTSLWMRIVKRRERRAPEGVQA
jgi:hypothetical protein